MATFLFVVPRFHTNLFFATRALIAAGHRVEVAVAKIAGTEDHSHVTPVEIGHEPEDAALRSLVLQTRPDLVVVRGTSRLTRRTAAAGRREGAGVLRYDQHPAIRTTSVGRRISNFLLRRPAHRITPVPGLDPTAARDPMARYIPFPVAALPLDGTVRSPDWPVRLLCIGKLAQRRKRQPALIDALRNLANPARSFRLTIVGSSAQGFADTDDAHYQAQIAAARELDWLDIREDVPFAEMPAIYASHDICVLPSSGEPLGSAPLEGMAYGTIPVISISAGSAGLIEENVTGLRVDICRDGALERALCRLIEDRTLRTHMSEAARRFAETELSPARYVARMEALLPRRRR